MSDREIYCEREITEEEYQRIIERRKQIANQTLKEVQQNKNYLRYGETQNYKANNQNAIRKAVKSTIAKQTKQNQDDFSILSLIPFIAGFIVFIIICVVFCTQNG